MAGFKQTLVNHDPVLFITFDGDPYDPSTRLLTAVPPTIQDESRYANNALLNLSSVTAPFPGSYRLGMTSLVELEITDNKAGAFGWYGNQTTSAEPWQKAYLEVVNQTQYSMPNNNGSFSISFMMNRQSDETAYRNSFTPTNTATLVRPVIRKAGMVYMYFQDLWGNTDRFIIDGPDGKSLTWLVPTDARELGLLYNQNNLFNIIYDVKMTQPGVFTCRFSLYINAREVTFTEWTTLDTPPVVSTTASWEIMGLINNGGVNHNDRQTSPVTIDQLAVFNKAFTPNEVGSLYKKLWGYSNFIVHAGALHYYTMAEAESSTDPTMFDTAWNSNPTGGTTNNRYNGVYLGGTGKVSHSVQGPLSAIGSLASSFNAGGMAAVHRTSTGYLTVFDPTGDWSYEMWIKIRNSDRSVIFSNQIDDYPFNGHLLEANVRNGANVLGSLQFSTSDRDTDRLVTKQLTANGANYNFSNDTWHHVSIVRSVNRVSLYVNGELHDSKDIPIRRVTSPGPGQFYFMGMMPGDLNTNGEMCNVAVYDRALQVQEIFARVNYGLIFYVTGNVTYFGNPYVATVRVLNHGTGELITEVQSNRDTGTYSAILPNNDLIDLMVLNKQDINVRYRVYGPITPAQSQDNPR